MICLSSHTHFNTFVPLKSNRIAQHPFSCVRRSSPSLALLLQPRRSSGFLSCISLFFLFPSSVTSALIHEDPFDGLKSNINPCLFTAREAVLVDLCPCLPPLAIIIFPPSRCLSLRSYRKSTVASSLFLDFIGTRGN